MRLKYIRLAGFKSFVDVTKVPFPEQMTCIVGPNGCGKSNVIDAVRWVLGESSAKNLRGDAMTDVIFNGSSARKPVSQASVELVFDNSAGRIQGEYANYQEISVRRLVTREGQSQYFLNGTRCRRRDITDLFLGTGLGPRSYAIIEQGTISRLIESRPQELRVFVEEAAGVSRYKERRRETENRIRRTRENLERLEDVREELNKQVQKLQRQAASARRYQALKKQERRLKAELQAIRWLRYQEHYDQVEQQLREQETELERWQAEQRGSERGQTELREREHQTQAQLEQVQQEVYQYSNQLTRLEQQIQHNRELAQRRRQQEDTLAREQTELNADIEQLNDELQRLQQVLNEQQNELDELAEELAAAELRRDEAEQDWQEFQAHEQAQREQVARLRQELSVAEAEAQAGHREFEQNQQRLTRLEQSLNELAGQQEQTEDDLLTELTQLQERRATLREQAESLQANIGQLTGQLTEQQEQQQETRQLQQQAAGRQASLEQLLAARQPEPSAAEQRWLAEHELLGSLHAVMQLPSHWLTAAEALLGDWLASPVIQQAPRQAPPQLSSVVLWPGSETDPPAGSLAEVCQGPARHLAILRQTAIADDETQARELLKSGRWSVVVTATGRVWGQGWVRQQLAEEHSQLHWQQSLQEVEQTLTELARETAQQGRGMADTEQELQEQQQELEACRQAEQQTGEQLARVQERQQAAERAARDRQQRQTQLATEQAQLQERQAELELQQEALVERQATLADQLAAAEPEQARREQRGRQLQEAWQQARDQHQQQQQRQHQQQLVEQHSRTELEHVQRNLRQARERLERLETQQADLTAEPVPETTELEEEQAAVLLQREEVVGRQQELQEQLSSVQEELGVLSSGQSAVQVKIDQQREAVESSKLELASARERGHALLDTLAEMSVTLKDVLADLPESAEESQWQEELSETSRKIGQLGAINLAAIEELASQSERQAYLDEQYDDLNASLATLEEAMRKIDRETRQRFKTTYDQINQDLGQLFPKVFGGGTAWLELTDEDLLETGVTIMARPPGKRNSTIHLLSGGEKALTALALVFAIFRLNPAPFCLLDEVDAPLDDVNVGRFCRLVKDMSESVQFVFISHNKVSMEMASHLTGVTMQEPGVSRLVAVDVDEALAMAEAS